MTSHIKMFIFCTGYWILWLSKPMLLFGRRFKIITPVTLQEHKNAFSQLFTWRNAPSSPEFYMVNGLLSVNDPPNFWSEQIPQSQQIWDDIWLLWPIKCNQNHYSWVLSYGNFNVYLFLDIPNDIGYLNMCAKFHMRVESEMSEKIGLVKLLEWSNSWNGIVCPFCLLTYFKLRWSHQIG